MYIARKWLHIHGNSLDGFVVETKAVVNFSKQNYYLNSFINSYVIYLYISNLKLKIWKSIERK